MLRNGLKEQLELEHLYNVETIKSIRDAVGTSDEAVKKYDEQIAQLEKDHAKVVKIFQGSGRSGLSADRIDTKMSDALKSATDKASQLILKNNELKHSLDGNTLGAAMEKIKADYQHATQEVERERDKLKTGKIITPEITAQLDIQKVQLALEKEQNTLLAERADLYKFLQDKSSYNELIGATREAHKVQAEYNRELAKSLHGFEELAALERARQDDARANGDALGMLQTGFQGLSNENYQKYIDYFEKGIPNAVGKSSDALADLTFEFASGSKSWSEALQGFGKTMTNITNDIIQEFLRIQMRMILFGEQASYMGGGGSSFGGGLFGALANGIAGMFGGGATASSSLGSGLASTNWSSSASSMLWSAKQHTGGIVGKDASSMQLISSSLFDNAPRYHSGGYIKGLRPDERPIIAQTGERVLSRAETAAYGRNSAPVVQMKVEIHNNTNSNVEVQQSTDGNGMPKIDVFILDMVDKGLANRQRQGKSDFGNTLMKQTGLNRATTAYRT